MTRLQYQITCKFSGLHIGTLDYEIVAGHMPYLSHWDNMVALHPVFSLSTAKLLSFARGEWSRLAKAADDGQATQHEENLLRVCFLAVLHSLECITQEAPSLPPLHIVQNNMNALFKLAYWRHYLNSKRFSFPEFKINRFNNNDRFENLNHYIDACFKVKEDYEKGLNDLVEAEKVAAADRALKALRDNWVTPVSNKQLFRWIKAHLPEKYQNDLWMQALFCGSDKQILVYDKDEIELLEAIITEECPHGTAILNAVRNRIAEIWQVFTDHKEAFTVDFEELDLDSTMQNARAVSSAPLSTEAPKQSDYPSKALFIRANALFYLQQRKITISSDSVKDSL